MDKKSEKKEVIIDNHFNVIGEDILKIGSIYKHKKRGTQYKIINIGTFQFEDSKIDMKPVIVYKDTDEHMNNVWVRPNVWALK